MANPILTKMRATGAVDWFQQLFAHDSVRSSFHNTQEAYKAEAARVAAKLAADEGAEESEAQPLMDHLSLDSEQDDLADLLQPLQAQEDSVTTAKQLKTYLSSLIKKLFLHTFTIEGLDVIAGTVTTAKGVIRKYEGETFSVSMVVTALLGLRNRPDSMRNGAPSISALQVWKNFWGGWFDRKRPAKTVLESVAYFTFVKFFMFIISVVLVPVKIVLNVVKFVAQFLPSFLVHISGSMLGFSAANLMETLESNTLNLGKKAGGFILFGSAMILSAVVHYPLRLVAYIARAATSPLKNAELAWAFGAMFKIQGWPKLSFALSKLLGIIAVAISFAVTSIVWAIALPFTIAAATTWIPALGTALNTVLAYPLVANALTAVNGAVTATYSFLGLSSVVSTVATAAVSAGTFLGVQISTAAVILGATAGLIAAPVAIITADTAQAFSHAWVRWNKVSFVEAFFPRLHAVYTQRQERKAQQRVAELHRDAWNDEGLVEVSDTTLKLVQTGHKDLHAASASSQKAHRHGFRACHEEPCFKRLLDDRLVNLAATQETAPASTPLNLE